MRSLFLKSALTVAGIAFTFSFAVIAVATPPALSVPSKPAWKIQATAPAAKAIPRTNSGITRKGISPRVTMPSQKPSIVNKPFPTKPRPSPTGKGLVGRGIVTDPIPQKPTPNPVAPLPGPRTGPVVISVPVFVGPSLVPRTRIDPSSIQPIAQPVSKPVPQFVPKNSSRPNGVMAMNHVWQPNTQCLAFGGAPDINNNGIPDVIVFATGGNPPLAIKYNPAEPLDAFGVPAFLHLDANGDNVMDWLSYFWTPHNSLFQDPFGDDDGDLHLNFEDEYFADNDGDGLVNLNDPTPCGDAVGGDNIPNVGGGPFFPIPIPMPLPRGVRPPSERVFGLGEPTVFHSDEPVEHSVLALSIGDVDADSDNSSPTRESDHSATEETVEDSGEGMLIEASLAEVRQFVPFEVMLNTVTDASRVRFGDDGNNLTLWSSNPLANSNARQIEWGTMYSTGDFGFSAGTFRRFYIEATTNSRHRIAVEVDSSGRDEWLVVDGLIMTARGASTAQVAALSASQWLPAAAIPQVPTLCVSDVFLLPAQGIGTAKGKVAIKCGAIAVQCEVIEWTNSLLKAQMTGLALDSPAPAHVIVTLADGREAASISVTLLPAAAAVTQASTEIANAHR